MFYYLTLYIYIIYIQYNSTENIQEDIQKFKSFFSRARAVWGENLLYVSGGGIVYVHLSQWVIYRIVATDVRSRREGRYLRKVGFYDPIKNKTFSNVPVILYFLERGAQPTGTVYDILKRRPELFKERTLS